MDHSGMVLNHQEARLLAIVHVPFIFNIAEFKETIIMASKASLTSEIISQAESYDGIRAGIVRLEDVLQSPSYQVDPKGPESRSV